MLTRPGQFLDLQVGLLAEALLGRYVGDRRGVVIGRIGDYAGLRSGMMFLYLTFGFVLSVGFWARPLVTNAIIGSDKKTAPAAAV